MRTTILLAVMAALALGQMPGGGVLVNQDGSLGLKLTLEPKLKEWDFGDAGGASIGHALDAVFGSKMDSLPNHLFADISGGYERLDWPARNFVFEAKLRGARLEATQDFRKVDLATKAEVSLFYSKAFAWVFNLLRAGPDDYLRTASPVSLTIGFNKLFGVARRDTLGPDWGSRLDAGLFAAIPLKNFLILSCRARLFTLPADAFRPGNWQYVVEPAITYSWSGKWLHVKYEKGALPPKYEPFSNWSIGAGFSFD